MEDMDYIANFDEDNTDIRLYDPTGGIVNEGFGNANRGRFQSKSATDTGQISIRIRNFTNTSQKIELFNANRHVTRYPNPSVYNIADCNWQPLSYLGFQVAQLALNSYYNQSTPSSFAPQNGVALFTPQGAHAYIGGVRNRVVANSIGFGNKGFDMNNLDTDSSSTIDIRIQCAQVPYSALLEDLKNTVLEIKNLKMRFSSEAQISNNIELYRYRTFGAEDKNSLEPSTFINPANSNIKVIDIPRTMLIDGQTAWYMTLEPLEDLNITFTVTAFKNNGLEVF